MQISLRIRHSAPELCPMHLKNVVSARTEQTCIFHRLTRLLYCPVACTYNMPNKILKRRFLRKILRIFFCVCQYFFCVQKRRPSGLLLNNLARFCHADAGRSNLVIRIDVSVAI